MRNDNTTTRLDRLATIVVALGSLAAMTTLAAAGDTTGSTTMQLAQATQQRPQAAAPPPPPPSYFQNLRRELTQPAITPPPVRNQPGSVAGVRG